MQQSLAREQRKARKKNYTAFQKFIVKFIAFLDFIENIPGNLKVAYESMNEYFGLDGDDPWAEGDRIFFYGIISLMMLVAFFTLIGILAH